MYDATPSLVRQETSSENLRIFKAFSSSNDSNAFVSFRPKTSRSQLSLTDLSQSVETNQVFVTFPFLVIDPQGKFRRVWILILFIFYSYTVWIYPARLAFSPLILDWNDWMSALNFIADLVFLADLVLRFLTAFEDGQGKLVYKLWDIMNAYLQTWFLFDFVTAFPFTWFVPAGPISGIEDDIDGLRLISLLCILRIFKLMRFHSELKITEHNLIGNLRLSPRTFLTIKFLLLIALTVHISACLWFFFAKLQPVETLEFSWIYVNELDDTKADSFQQYIASVYFVITVLMSIGYGSPMCPQTELEKTLFILIVIFALSMFGYILGICIKLFGNSKAELVQLYVNIKLFLENFTETLHISKILNSKMLFYFQKNFHSQKNILENYRQKIMDLLPLELQFKVLEHVMADFLGKFEFFVDKPKEFVVRILRNLSPAYYTPGDEIYKQGDPSLFMYFVQNGRAVTCCEDASGKERAQIYPEGTYFGEVDMINGQERLENCFAETELKLLKMPKPVLFEILSDFSEVAEEMKTLARKRLEIRKTYRKPKSLTASLIPRSYWIWKKTKNCAGFSIEDTHLHERRSTIRQSIIEGLNPMNIGGRSPSLFKSVKSLRTMKTLIRKNTLLAMIKLIGIQGEENLEVEEGEIESISREKVAGMINNEFEIAEKREEILKIFGFSDDNKNILMRKHKKLGPVRDLDTMIEGVSDINGVLKIFLEELEEENKT